MAGRGAPARRRPELGQHFLAGERLAAELVEQAGVGPADLVVEIGAGTGVLTRALARRAGRVLAVGRLLDDPRSPLQRADLIVQAEAARRYAAATPATPRTIRWGVWYELTVRRRLPAACFRPPPRVAAAVLVARRRRPPLVPLAGRQRLATLLRAGFRDPGTPLRRSLVPPLSRGQLRRLARDLDFPLDAGAADLDARQWAGIVAYLR